jgi:capsid protein
MPPGPRGPQRAERPRGKTPAERGEEAAEVQRKLKREAAERREAAASRVAGQAPADDAARRPS